MENSKLLVLSANQAIRVDDESAALVNFDFELLNQYSWAVTQNGRVITEKDGKYGLVINGEEFCKPIYDDILEEDDRDKWKIGVRLGDKWKYGIVDAIGRKLCEPIYDKILIQHGGTYYVVLEGKIGLLDKVGKELCKPKYEEISYLFSWPGNWATVKLDGKTGLLDLYSYKEVCAPKYDSIEMCGDFWKVCVDGKYGLLNSTFEEVCSPKYDAIGWKYYDGIEVSLNGKWGVMDLNGKEVVAPQYHKIKLCVNGLIALKLDKNWMFVNSTGENVSEFLYHSLHITDAEYIYARRGWKKCKIDKTGKEVKITRAEKQQYFGK